LRSLTNSEEFNMNRLSRWLLSLLVIGAVSSPAGAAVSVFACEPEWGALVNEIAGSRASVYVATTAMQNPHVVQARPSFIARARTADLIIYSGAELEVGYLPLILQQSGNDKIQIGKPGNLDSSRYVPLIELPPVLDRSMGDVHPMGNPHIHYDPRNMILVAEELKRRLQRIDASGSAEYEARYQAFAERMRAAIKQWEQEAASLKGVAVIENHKEVSYLFNWLNMPIVGSLEPKPGVEPTSGHLLELVENQKSHPARMIVPTTNRDPKPAEWLSERIKVPVVSVPLTVGGSPRAKDLFSLYDDAIKLLLADLKS
jgi:zinc/manganese transport system substrate-binding protein